MSVYVDIKTKTGIYRVRKPLGRIGAIHFGIVTKYVQGNQEGVVSPAQQEALGEGYIEWTEKVLPKILISFKPEGKDEEVKDYKVDDMTGEDQFAIFAAMVSLIQVSEDYFQVVGQ